MKLSLVHEEYRVLDVMKFVMAIVVVAIHTPTPCAIYYGSEMTEEDFRLLHNTIEELRVKGANIKEYKMYLDPYSRDFNLKCKEI